MARRRARAGARAGGEGAHAGATGVLQYYVTGFRDGHLRLGGPFNDRPRWAGWFAAYEGGRFVVAHAEPDWPRELPPVGATILACDSRAPLALLAADVAPWVDRRIEQAWSRERLAPQLTIDMGEIAGRGMPSRCTFAMPGGKARSLSLHYRDIDRGTLNARFRGVRGGPDRAVFSLEDLGHGRWWVPYARSTSAPTGCAGSTTSPPGWRRCATRSSSYSTCAATRRQQRAG